MLGGRYAYCAMRFSLALAPARHGKFVARTLCWTYFSSSREMITRWICDVPS